MPSNEILSLAILEPVAGKDEECLAFLREFYSLLHRKGYSQDLLYRDAKTPGQFVHLRIWRSDEARSEAQQDPEVHRFWLRLADFCAITTIHETLEELYSSYESTKA
jgi:hypothetical protein